MASNLEDEKVHRHVGETWGQILVEIGQGDKFILTVIAYFKHVVMS